MLVLLQPDLLISSDRVAGQDGHELCQRSRELSPRTRVMIQVDEDRRSALFPDKLADLVLSHRATPGELSSVVIDLDA